MQSVLGIISFTNANLLWGLLAISIPIIIHLFNLRKVKKVQFSNTAFLKKIKEESSAKRKPVELLILVSRILGIALLVLAFAQPFYKDEENELELGSRVLIYLDNSQSSSAIKQNNSSSLDLLVAEAYSIIESYPQGTAFQFIENSYANSISAQYTQESIKELLTEIGLVGVDRSLNEIVSRIESYGFSGDIYLLSDFQGKTEDFDFAEDTTNQYYLVPDLNENVTNVFIDTVYLENTFTSGTFANLLKIRLRRNYRDVESINLQLFIENQLYGTSEVDFENQLTVDHEFEIEANTEGLGYLELKFDDGALAYDNNFFASVNSLDKVNVIEIYSESSPNYINALFADNDVFEFKRQDSRFIDNELLEAANIIVINQVTSISNQLINVVNGFRESGGSVMIIPSVNNTVQELSTLGVMASKESQQRIQLQEPNFQNPLFQDVFEEENDDIEMPDATPIFRLNNAELEYLNFRNGRPFLSKINSEGNVFFFSSPFDKEFTSFTNHALFVPVLYKLALGSKVSLSNLYYYTDSETIFYPIESGANREIFQLSSSTQRIIPDQRIETERLILQIPKGEIVPGHYDLQKEDKYLGALAFNVPKSESQLNKIDPQVFDQFKNIDNVRVIESVQGERVGQFLQAGVAGLPLWKYALLGALFFLFVEIILIRYL